MTLRPSRLRVGWSLIILWGSAWGCGDSRRPHATDAMSAATDAASDGRDSSSGGDHVTGGDADGVDATPDGTMSPVDGPVVPSDATADDDGPAMTDGATDGAADGAGDANMARVSCMDTCAFKDKIGCGGGATCVERCESDPGRMRCPKESDNLATCILEVGEVALTCVNGLPTLKSDYCSAQQRAAMACLLRDAG